MKQSLGLVEISGLSTAVVVADTMAKAANIQILEIENTRGLGYMTIKITGDVGAVNAAVDAGSQIGRMNGKLVSCKVIPRPSDYVENTFCKGEPPEQPTPPEGPEVTPEEPEVIPEEPTGEQSTAEPIQIAEPEGAKVLEEPETLEEPEAKTAKKPTGRTGNSKRK